MENVTRSQRKKQSANTNLRGPKLSELTDEDFKTTICNEVMKNKFVGNEKTREGKKLLERNKWKF